jgi:hypothetical protein
MRVWRVRQTTCRCKLRSEMPRKWAEEDVMNGSALYYPTIDVRDSIWLRSALLYWDKIYTIVPRAIEAPYKTDDTAICAKEGQLFPLYCDDHPEVIKRLGERTLELVEQVRSPLPFTVAVGESEPNLKEVLAAYQSPTRRQLHPGKFGLTQLHPDKVSYELRNLFDRSKGGSSKWMLVDAPFSDLYMAALALLLAEEQPGLVPVTNDATEHGSAVYALLADSSDVIEPQPSTLISLTLKSLRIDPSTPVQDLIRFKQKRAHQLKALGGKLEELNAKIKETGDRKDVEYQAKKIYIREVEKSWTTSHPSFVPSRSRIRGTPSVVAWRCLSLRRRWLRRRRPITCPQPLQPCPAPSH